MIYMSQVPQGLLCGDESKAGSPDRVRLLGHLETVGQTKWRHNYKDMKKSWSFFGVISQSLAVLYKKSMGEFELSKMFGWQTW